MPEQRLTRTLRDIESLTDAQVRELRTMRAPMVRRKR